MDANTGNLTPVTGPRGNQTSFGYGFVNRLPGVTYTGSWRSKRAAALPPALGLSYSSVGPVRSLVAGIVPRRPARKSSTAWTNSSRVFITNGP